MCQFTLSRCYPTPMQMLSNATQTPNQTKPLNTLCKNFSISSSRPTN